MKQDNNNEFEIKAWSQQHEKILAEWSDKAMCYRWLHSRAQSKYSFMSKLFTIPVIVLSTLTGTANFAIERIPEDYQSITQISIGSLNIIAGIITTIQQFLKINELNESHRIASISWGKFYRNIKTELLKIPSERCDVNYLLKTSQEEFDRLIETSPPIDMALIKTFHNNFKDIEGGISKPDICNNIQPTNEVIYKISEENMERREADKIIDLIKQKQETINKEIMIEDFTKNFIKEYSRNPTALEIYENLEDSINKEVIQNYIKKHVKS